LAVLSWIVSSGVRLNMLTILELTGQEMAVAESTQEDITIARVVLAGWQIVPWPTGYMVYRPDGKHVGSRGSRGSRYTAAMLAERLMEAEDAVAR
jgi:hypothetical protein